MDCPTNIHCHQNCLIIANYVPQYVTYHEVRYNYKSTELVTIYTMDIGL